MSQQPVVRLVPYTPGQVLTTADSSAAALHAAAQQQLIATATAPSFAYVNGQLVQLNQPSGQPPLLQYTTFAGGVNAHPQHIQVIPTPSPQNPHEQPALFQHHQQQPQLQFVQFSSPQAPKLPATSILQIGAPQLVYDASGQLIGQVTQQVTNFAPYQVINPLANGQATIALQPQAGIVHGQAATTILQPQQQQLQPQAQPQLPSQTLITSHVPVSVPALNTNAISSNLISTSHTTTTKVTCKTNISSNCNVSKILSNASDVHQHVHQIIQQEKQKLNEEKEKVYSSSHQSTVLRKFQGAASRTCSPDTVSSRILGCVMEEIPQASASSKPASPRKSCSPPTSPLKEGMDWDDGSNLGGEGECGSGDHDSCSCDSSRTSSVMEPESTMGGDGSSHSTIRQIQSNCTAGETPQIVDGVNLQEVREFANAFKTKRLHFGLTQTQVGQALAQSQGPTYSQSAICRFEKLEITPKSALKIMPVLKEWMAEAEKKYNSGDLAVAEIAGGPDSSRRRKRRTSFSPAAIEVLNHFFSTNTTHPDSSQMTSLADKLNYDREVIRVWFCNKRQALKNTVRRIENDSNNNNKSNNNSISTT